MRRSLIALLLIATPAFGFVATGTTLATRKFSRDVKMGFFGNMCARTQHTHTAHAP